VEVINILVDHGFAVDAKDRESGATPLMIAAALGRSAAVAALLARGASPELLDSAGHNALDRARQTDDPATIQLLESALAHGNPAHPSKVHS
jgi:ankyrin repeat protein